MGVKMIVNLNKKSDLKILFSPVYNTWGLFTKIGKWYIRRDLTCLQLHSYMDFSGKEQQRDITTNGYIEKPIPQNVLQFFENLSKKKNL